MNDIGIMTELYIRIVHKNYHTAKAAIVNLKTIMATKQPTGM